MKRTNNHCSLQRSVGARLVRRGERVELEVHRIGTPFRVFVPLNEVEALRADVDVLACAARDAEPLELEQLPDIDTERRARRAAKNARAA